MEVPIRVITHFSHRTHADRLVFALRAELFIKWQHDSTPSFIIFAPTATVCDLVVKLLEVNNEFLEVPPLLELYYIRKIKRHDYRRVIWCCDYV